MDGVGFHPNSSEYTAPKDDQKWREGAVFVRTDHVSLLESLTIFWYQFELCSEVHRGQFTVTIMLGI